MASRSKSKVETFDIYSRCMFSCSISFNQTCNYWDNKHSLKRKNVSMCNVHRFQKCSIKCSSKSRHRQQASKRHTHPKTNITMDNHHFEHEIHLQMVGLPLSCSFSPGVGGGNISHLISSKQLTFDSTGRTFDGQLPDKVISKKV